MRIQIISKAGLIEPAAYFSCDNHRVVSRGIISTVAYWSVGGAKLAERDVALPPKMYAAWCKLTEDDEDEPFILAAHMESLGLTAAPPPPPPLPEIKETDDERITRETAERDAQIADLKQRIADAQAQLELLTS